MSSDKHLDIMPELQRESIKFWIGTDKADFVYQARQISHNYNQMLNAESTAYDAGVQMREIEDETLRGNREFSAGAEEFVRQMRRQKRAIKKHATCIEEMDSAMLAIRAIFSDISPGERAAMNVQVAE